jgi:DNA-binding NtrC family response regulator
VRVIAATNRNLQEQVAAKTFRLDLYYRLNVVHLQLPPLRERLEDIPLLAEHFIDRFNHLQDRRVSGITDEALAMLGRHGFPGNVRELENLIERAFVLCGPGPIDTPHLPDDLGRTVASPAPAPATMREAEIQVLRATLDRHHGNRNAVARELGMHRSTLFRKMRALGLET